MISPMHAVNANNHRKELRMCVLTEKVEHTATLRLSLLEAFRNNGLRDVEKRARDIICRRCTEPIPDDLIVELDRLYDRALPVAQDGRIDLYTDHPILVDAFPTVSERTVFCLLVYLTSGGTSIEPLRNPVAEFNHEFKESCGKDGALDADSRLGRMSSGAFAREKARASEAGELWYDAKLRNPSEIALVALSRYGIEMPDFLHWSHNDDDDGNRRYADILSRDELVRYDRDGKPTEVNHAFDEAFVRCFRDHRDDFNADWKHFRIACNGLFDATGTQPYIMPAPDMFHPGIDPGLVPGFKRARIGGVDWFIHDRFIIWLASLDTWDDVAGGVLNEAVVDTLI